MASVPRQLTGFALAAASVTSPVLPTGSSATLDPIVFFSGRSHGEGKLDTMLKRPVALVVESHGKRQGDTLILDQTIREGAKPARARRWVMRPIAPGRYTGTLTEAEGPVIVSVVGPRAYIRYRMRGGLEVDQQLALQSDEMSLLNRLYVRKFGVRVATVHETIRKLN
jgi:hypothetical protein